jgi:hypothetical protein
MQVRLLKDRPVLLHSAVFLFLGINRKEPQASVHSYHSGLAELALANQNALPSSEEENVLPSSCGHNL